MNRSMSLLVQGAILFGVIALPHPERAEQLDMAITRGRLIENGYIVADAAERFAEAVNPGHYASSVAGLMSLLPGRQGLLNPATLARTEPIDGSAAYSGSVGYTPVNMQGYNVGYWITVFGRDATVGPWGDGILMVLEKVTDPPPPPTN